MDFAPQTRVRLLDIVLLIVAAVSAGFLVVNLVSPNRSIPALFLAGLAFTASLLILLGSWLDPDRIRASQSNAMLTLAGETLESMTNRGLDTVSAQEVCELMLPATSAIAVAITDKERILGYAGRDKAYNEVGSLIQTQATHTVIQDAQMLILRTQEEIGLPLRSVIHAAIIAPLFKGEEVIGALKFYYPSSVRLTETEESIAQGFAELLSTQISANALEEQHRLFTSMELKLLQSQINPHFLFNTINTISALIRTDPAQARELLRDFATFYRRTLEDASDLITLERELDQTERYLRFEIARFGEDRLQFSTALGEGVRESLVPAFLVQPLVENAVRHAMPSEGTLHITCSAQRTGADLTLVVEDDGLGMNEEAQAKLLEGGSSKGLGLALKNIQERIRGYYGPESYMQVESEEGKGTSVQLFLKGSCAW